MTQLGAADGKMRAAAINGAGGPEVLGIAEADIPEPKTGEVLIKVAAAGINRPDSMQRRGLYPPPPGASPIPGLEVSGTVEAISPGTDTVFEIGDKVAALLTGGGYAQYACAPVQQVLPWPSNLNAAQAAALPETFFTVWSNLFQRAYADEGDTLLVHGGTSGIGTTAIMLGKAFGLKVFATAGSDEKCAFMREFGADLAINYKTQDFVDVVKDATDGNGVDVVLDMIGGDYIERNIKCMAVNGRHVTIAFMNGPKANLNLAPVMLKRLTLTGSTLRARSADFKGVIARELHELVWPLLESGQIAPVIDSTFALDDVVAAHTRLESSQHIGKIILEM